MRESKGPIPPSLQGRPWSAIILFLSGVALLVMATIRGAGALPLGGARSQMSKMWEKDPGSDAAGHLGLVCIGLGLWLARMRSELSDRNDPIDDLIVRLVYSDPLRRAADTDSRDRPN